MDPYADFCPECGCPLGLATGIDPINSIWARGFLYCKAASGTTSEERRAAADPRPSLEERYATHEDYLEKLEKTARQLHENGYILDEDIPRLIDGGGGAFPKK